jgi:hypothetical protein
MIAHLERAPLLEIVCKHGFVGRDQLLKRLLLSSESLAPTGRCSVRQLVADIVNLALDHFPDGAMILQELCLGEHGVEELKHPVVPLRIHDLQLVLTCLERDLVVELRLVGIAPVPVLDNLESVVFECVESAATWPQDVEIAD